MISARPLILKLACVAYTNTVARTSICMDLQGGGASVELFDNGVRRSGRRGGGETGRREESGGTEKLLGFDEAVPTDLLEAVMWRMVCGRQLVDSSRAEEAYLIL